MRGMYEWGWGWGRGLRGWELGARDFRAVATAVGERGGRGLKGIVLRAQDTLPRHSEESGGNRWGG